MSMRENLISSSITTVQFSTDKTKMISRLVGSDLEYRRKIMPWIGENGVALLGVDVESTTTSTELFKKAGELLNKPHLIKLTDGAMNGDDVFFKSLIMRARETQATPAFLDYIDQSYINTSTPEALSTIWCLNILKRNNLIDYAFVTGGFINAMPRLATKYGVPSDQIIGNILYPKSTTYRYTEIADNEPQAHSKEAVFETSIYDNLSDGPCAMIGDGDGDMVQNVALRIGYGGIALRDATVKKSDVYIADLRIALPLVLGWRKTEFILQSFPTHHFLRQTLVAGLKAISRGRGIIFADKDYRKFWQEKKPIVDWYLNPDRDVVHHV